MVIKYLFARSHSQSHVNLVAISTELLRQATFVHDPLLPHRNVCHDGSTSQILAKSAATMREILDAQDDFSARTPYTAKSRSRSTFEDVTHNSAEDAISLSVVEDAVPVDTTAPIEAVVGVDAWTNPFLTSAMTNERVIRDSRTRLKSTSKCSAVLGSGPFTASQPLRSRVPAFSPVAVLAVPYYLHGRCK